MHGLKVIKVNIMVLCCSNFYYKGNNKPGNGAKGPPSKRMKSPPREPITTTPSNDVQTPLKHKKDSPSLPIQITHTYYSGEWYVYRLNMAIKSLVYLLSLFRHYPLFNNLFFLKIGTSLSPSRRQSVYGFPVVLS